MDFDILAQPNPVSPWVGVEFGTNWKSWIRIHKDLDVGEADASWGTMTHAKASEKSKTGMTRRWVWGLGGELWRE